MKVHQLVQRIETSFANQKIVLTGNLDAERKFDNTSSESTVLAAGKRSVEATIYNCIKTMLNGRRVEAAQAEAIMKVTVNRGCLQGEVLSPVLWVIVIALTK